VWIVRRARLEKNHKKNRIMTEFVVAVAAAAQCRGKCVSCLVESNLKDIGQRAT
jgi:hypothetical protein